MNPIFIIPARLASTRLLNKPLADIHGEPMILHVWRRVMEAGLGPVVVACCRSEIADVIRAAGGTAILTDPNLPSGTDRINSAVDVVDPDGKHDIVVNVQGDLPTLPASILNLVLRPLADASVDIATLAAPISDEAEILALQVVKIAMTEPHNGISRAHYFSRSPIPANAITYYHHIGIYAYRRASLKRYVELPPSYLEMTEKLEQLRAIENGMRIDVAITDLIPVGVDTPEDLERVRESRVLWPSLC